MAAQLPEDVVGFGTPLLTAAEEKESLHGATNRRRSTSNRPARSPPADGMSRTTRPLLVTLFVCLLVALGLATAITPGPWSQALCQGRGSKARGAPALSEADVSSFQQLLDAVSPDSLHDILHRYLPDIYRHGVYPSDHSAMEAVHRVNAALASSMVHLAKRDNTTTTTTTPSTTTTTTSGADTTATSSPTTADTSAASSNITPTSTSSVTTYSTTESTSPQSVKPVTSTFTSVVNGTPTVVVATSYVGVEGQDAGSSTMPPGSLQTNNALPVRHYGGGLLAMEAVVVGAAIGGAMLV